MIIVTRFHMPASATADPTAPGYSAWGPIDLDQPFVGWRSQSNTAGHGVTYDLGASKAVYGVSLDGCNVPQVSIDYSSDGVSWNTLAIASPVDARDGRRKAVRDFGSSGVATRYIRVRAQQVSSDGSGVIYLGGIAIWAERLTLPATGELATLRTARIISGARAYRASEYYLEMELGAGALPRSQAEVLRALGYRDGVIVVQLTDGSAGDVYHVRCIEPPRIVERSSTVAQATRALLREVA